MIAWCSMLGHAGRRYIYRHVASVKVLPERICHSHLDSYLSSQNRERRPTGRLSCVSKSVYLDNPGHLNVISYPGFSRWWKTCDRQSTWNAMFSTCTCLMTPLYLYINWFVYLWRVSLYLQLHLHTYCCMCMHAPCACCLRNFEPPHAWNMKSWMKQLETCKCTVLFEESTVYMHLYVELSSF